MNKKSLFCALTACLAIVSGNAGATLLRDNGALAQYAFSSTGWATFGIVLPEGQATEALAVGTFLTQTDVKNRWVDGSIRYAILTAQITAAGTYDIREEAAPAGSFTPVAPDARLDLTIEGTHYISTVTASTQSTDVWLEGPLVKEYRIRDIPQNDGAEHPFLSNIWDIRIYSDGTARVDVTVENIRDVAIADGIVYGVDILLNNQNVFHRDAAKPGANPLTTNGCTSTTVNNELETGNYIRLTSGSQAGEVAIVGSASDTFGSYPVCFSGPQENVTWERVLYHPYATRWRRTFAVNGFTEAAVAPDFAPFIAANAVPAYMPTVDSPSRTEIHHGEGERYDILNFGRMTMYMPTSGGREDIGPYPDWTAQYIVHKTASQREYMLAHADLAGSWSGHYAKNDPSGIVTVNEKPDYWLDGRAWGDNKPLNNLKGVANTPDGAHVPSLAYVPYLITGDRYYSDEMLHYANHAVSGSWPGPEENGRSGEQGLLWQNEMRGWAWRFRNVTDAANYLPDNHAYKAYFTGIMNNNLEAADKYSDNNPSPLGFIPLNTNSDRGYVTSPFPWQYAYMAWSLDHAIRQNSTADGSVLRDRILNMAVTVLNSDPDFPREYATMYWPAIGTRNEAGGIDYLSDWKEIFNANFLNEDNTIKPVPGWVGGYGNEMHMLMTLAKRAGLPKAAESLAWVDNEAANGNMIASLNARAAYALLEVEPEPEPEVEPEPEPEPGNETSTEFDDYSPSNGLKATATSGGLFISGLVESESFSVYNLQGQLIHQGKAAATEERVSLRERGVYIVTAGNRVVKAVY
ncbi:MAG: hypothetical protein LBF62_04880 [Tannerellaceae bacterium]|jgi:hypothetical protein|nr:hypothetical protein [Tannerellaceae bacterium]